MEPGRTTEDMNIGDNSFAASMGGHSVIQSTTPKPKLRRNRTTLCVYFVSEGLDVYCGETPFISVPVYTGAANVRLPIFSLPTQCSPFFPALSMPQTKAAGWFKLNIAVDYDTFTSLV